MEPNWSAIHEQLAAIKAQLGGLYADDADAELKTCRAYGNQLLLDGTALATSDTSAEEKHGITVSMRQAVNKLQEQLDEIKTKTAEAYRKHIGTDEKEAFEQLSPELQQQYNAQAYRSFAAFHAADELLDKLSKLNAALLDAGSELDRMTREEHTAAGRTTAAADVETFDRDPAPSSLSM
ncbi:hypothetical protein SD70_08315 [Gordoniibacillus kamchatkensis]|uniref:Uncharacterized protein n=1 Tax=Gordoniibacillus kamchatkensis TaxID=1590651 RepID=A0ABR5AJM5_9BACL|nr:hypothetical protein [Paenibacillus sp. VKM B-2647]KIL41249.1 hypothetical protein SD70_08315 [Paenibacillus sp. VKM B-2647]